MATLRTVTVGPSGRDYSTLSSAMSSTGEAGDISATTGSDEYVVFEMDDFTDGNVWCYNQGWVTEHAGGNYIHIKPSSSGSQWGYICERFYGGGATGPHHMILEGIKHYSSSNIPFIWREAGADKANSGYWILNCWIENYSSSSYGTVVNHPDNYVPVIFVNCVVVEMDKVDNKSWAGSSTNSFYNCTFDGLGGLFWDSEIGAYYGPLLYNCRVTNTGASFAWFNGTTQEEFASGSDYNLTDETTAPGGFGTNSVASATLDYTDQPNKDYHLDSSTDDGWEAGDDASITVPWISLTVDFDTEYTTRTGTWDIGAYEGSLTQPPITLTPSQVSASAVSNATDLVPGTAYLTPAQIQALATAYDLDLQPGGVFLSPAEGNALATALGPEFLPGAVYFHPDLGLANASVDLITVHSAVFLRPNADVSLGGWTNELGTTPVYPSLDEETPNDSDYGQSPDQPSDATLEIGFQTASDPSVSDQHRVRYRYRRNGPNAINLTVALYDGTTQIASWTHNNVTATYVTAEQTLTAPQADAITNYADLRLRFTATMA